MMERYQTGGLAALVATKPRPGPRSRLSVAAWEDLAAAMRRGEITTLRDAQRSLAERHQITYRSLNGVWWQLRRQRARKKTGRRRPRQANAQAQQAYQEHFNERPREATCPRAWAFDEGHFGLKVWFQRRRCPLKERPPWIVEDHDEWRWLYVAVEPATGQCVCFFLPGVDHARLQGFLDAAWEATGTEQLGLELDGSGPHTAHDLVWPEGIVPVPLPPYSPELNPVELLFRQLRARLANRIFADLAELEAAITAVLRE